MNKWVKFGLLAIISTALSIGVYFLFKELGVTDINSLRAIIEKCGVWGWLVFVLIQIVVTTFLCFIPATSATFIAVGVALFGSLKAFLLCGVSVFISSIIMFLMGRFAGKKVAIKLVGEDSLKKAQDLIDVKSKIALPLMFMFPIFPDDALCMVAGMTKMKFSYFSIITLIFRNIGIATICFLGSDFMLQFFSQLKLIEWILLINLVIFDIYAILKIAKKIENKIKGEKND